MGQFVVDRMDYQRSSRDVYNTRAVGLIALQATAVAASVPPTPAGGKRRESARGSGASVDVGALGVFIHARFDDARLWIRGFYSLQG